MPPDHGRARPRSPHSFVSPPGSHAVTSPFLEAVALACERDLRVLFEQLDFALRPGEMLQIAGPNGSGKTSLLRLLAGLMQPSAGEIRLGGRPLAEQRGELTRNLLWVGHAAGIKGLLSPEENLAWLSALHTAETRDSIWNALAAVGLRGFEDVPCHTLSAGQQRRVANRFERHRSIGQHNVQPVHPVEQAHGPRLQRRGQRPQRQCRPRRPDRDRLHVNAAAKP